MPTTMGGRRGCITPGPELRHGKLAQMSPLSLLQVTQNGLVPRELVAGRGTHPCCVGASSGRHAGVLPETEKGIAPLQDITQSEDRLGVAILVAIIVRLDQTGADRIPVLVIAGVAERPRYEHDQGLESRRNVLSGGGHRAE